MKKLEIIIACLLIAVVTAMAGIGTVNVTSSETTVLASSASRKWAVFQNNTTNGIWLKVDSSTNTLTTNNGIYLAPSGGTFTITASGAANPSGNIIKAISASGTNALVYQEGNEN